MSNASNRGKFIFSSRSKLAHILCKVTACCARTTGRCLRCRCDASRRRDPVILSARQFSDRSRERNREDKFVSIKSNRKFESSIKLLSIFIRRDGNMWFCNFQSFLSNRLLIYNYYASRVLSLLSLSFSSPLHRLCATTMI